ncbi:MAG: 4-alpha-glucanotransferase, partial [Gammaproteobacteria bacterium]|nr:4-alpha-glucanotransferase [Gammaproteobacteria bacterium]
MNGDSPLARLAVTHGIEPGYHDIWGNYHALSEDAARTLLAAMGVAADDDEDTERALGAHAAAMWARLLPPVCVRREDEGPWLALTCSDREAGATLEWRLRLEDGSEHSGTCAPPQLDVIEQSQRDGEPWSRRRLLLDCTPPPGYHTLSVTLGGRAGQTTLIITPRRCWPAPAAEAGRGRPWGVALQLYGVRSARNWGIGDLGDLGEAVTLFGTLGADLIGINPLHALYPDEPERASPYSPSSRRFANPLYLHIEAIPEFADCSAVHSMVDAPEFQASLQRVRAAELVDYVGVAALKWPVLRELYAHFRARHLDHDTARAADFRGYQVGGGEALRRHTAFEVLHAEYGSGPWPEELLDADAPAVAEFARVHSEDIEFHEYLQWLLESQIADVAARARESGMRIGLYRDLAVGSDAFGADIWSAKPAYAPGISIGAPPDDFSLQGQVWGLPPWLPSYLRESAYVDFIAALRANMRSSGALRIDHVIGMMRQFWVPSGDTAAHGAFVRCPIEDLLGIVALESVREQCLIVGED